MTRLRVVVADDEAPARAFLTSMVRLFEDLELVGEASNGAECVELIERVSPDLALIDLQMPEVDGLGVVRLLAKERTPLIAFVTAYDEYAVRAFEMNAIDYLLKPVSPTRLRTTVDRAVERLENGEFRSNDIERVRAAAREYATLGPGALLRRIPVRRRDDIILVPVEDIASLVADGEVVHITARSGIRHSLTHRLKDLEARLDPALFVRLSRGTLVNIGLIERITPQDGGIYIVKLTTGAEHQVSRLRGRVLKEQLLRL